jgi:hypothetical protein
MGNRVTVPLILTSKLDGGKTSAPRHGHFIPEEKASGTHTIRGWVGSRAHLDALVHIKISFPGPKSKHVSSAIPIVQPSHYTNLGISAPSTRYNLRNCQRR